MWVPPMATYQMYEAIEWLQDICECSSERCQANVGAYKIVSMSIWDFSGGYITIVWSSPLASRLVWMLFLKLQSNDRNMSHGMCVYGWIPQMAAERVYDAIRWLLGRQAHCYEIVKVIVEAFQFD